tara:strand:- start:4002 stop:4178 length:177 start_codon:yes stop_codon:yes gene_type:complete
MKNKEEPENNTNAMKQTRLNYEKTIAEMKRDNLLKPKKSAGSSDADKYVKDFLKNKEL